MLSSQDHHQLLCHQRLCNKLQLIQQKQKINKLIQENDFDEIRKIVKEVIEDNKDVVQRIKEGEDKLFGFLVGQIIKSSGGNINPSIAKDLLLKEL